MSDNKKYYYLKLKDNFFDTDAMILLENMQDGHLYSNILLKLYLRSLKDEGKLMFNNKIPYNSSALAQVTRHSVGTVEKALEIFQELELIEVLDNGAIFMSDIQNFIGESSTEADRKREYRRRIDSEKGIKKIGDGQMSGQMSDKNPPEIEIEKEIEIDTKSMEIFNHYISKNIINHKKFDSDMKRKVKNAIKKHGIDEVKKSIDNYAVVFHSDDYWFTQKYSLMDMMRDKDIRQFGTEADPLYNFAKEHIKKKETNNKKHDDIKRVDASDYLKKLYGG